MQQRNPVAKVFCALAVAAVAILITSSTTPAQSDAQPRTIHDACTGNCVVDTYFLHSGMGDTMAKNTYHSWYDTYYDLTSCNDTRWKNEFSFLVDVVSDIVGAPGAPTMQCWQGVLAQVRSCRNMCSEYFIPDAGYAPNVKLSLDSGSQGYLDVTLDNETNLGKLPELQPNSYSRRFPLQIYLRRGQGSALLVSDTEISSLSFPNWVTRGGYSDCVTAYGADSNRCTLIGYLTTPSSISTAVEFGEGALYDLTGAVDDLSDAGGSFSQDGFVVLYSDGDQITINQGPYAGTVWVRTHNKSTGDHTQHVTAWDASTGAVTITNHECNAFYCGIFGDRTESDTYVLALQGPDELLLAGTYTVDVVADIVHDRDINDNRVSYTYDASAVATQGEEDPDAVEATPEAEQPRVTDLPIIELPGPGTYAGDIAPDAIGAMYSLLVPEDIRSLSLRLSTLDGADYEAYTRFNNIPVPNYPTAPRWEYTTLLSTEPSESDSVRFGINRSETCYIFVTGNQSGGAFQLEVTWATVSEMATQVAEGNEQEPEEMEEIETQGSFSEVESNDSRANANSWDMQQPFTGQISRWGDRDWVLISMAESGIYTFSVTDVGQDMKVKLTLGSGNSGSYLDASRGSATGESVHLMFDASAGEQFYLIIQPIAMGNATDQAYRLTLSGFIPDPHESNDDRASASLWDITEGAIQGYFWDKTHGRSDYFEFRAPQTLDSSPVTFDLSNPAPDLRIRLSLLSASGYALTSTSYSPAGQPVTLSSVLEPGQTYYLKLEIRDLKTSLLPYTLSAGYSPGETQTETTDTGRPVRLRGFVYRQNGLLPLPLRDVAIYAQVTGQPAILLDTTGVLGTYNETLSMAEGQQVQIWAENAGTTFQPEEDNWSPDPRTRSHWSVFTAIGAQLDQQTPTPTSASTGTLLPPLLQTALATPLPSDTPAARATRPPSGTPTAEATILPSSTPPPEQAGTTTVISGTVWRLFPDSEPVGVGAAQLILSVNGVERPAVLSMIDGFYQMEIPGLQDGDQLSLRADGPQDDFEPIFFPWQVEQGVDKWQYDFYSYWGSITPPARDDQNLIHGWVLDDSGHGIPGVYLTLQMGKSDAFQRLGPTDAAGYYETAVRLPSRIMATVWVDQSGYLPARMLFFHPYAPEDRELNFRLAE